MQRSLWKGAISFGLVHIPVQLFSAESHHGLDLDLLDKRDFAAIGYKRYNKNTGKEVEWDNIVKGYEYESGQYVVLSDAELKHANVKATSTIDILAFVDAAQVPLIYYEQPYYLAPDKGGDKVYALLRETLQRAQKIAIAQIVIRTKQRLVALLPMEKMLAMNTLRYADEIRAIDEYDLPSANLKEAGISEKELQMALTLVEGMSENWDPSQYHDTYSEDILALVESKVKAHMTKTLLEPEAEATRPRSAKVIDLMALLKESINTQGSKAAPTKSRAKPAAGKARKTTHDTHRAAAASRAQSDKKQRKRA